VKITFIGCGDACASGGRNQTCLYIEDENRTFLLDCGPASLAALKKNNIDINKIDFILNTHMHGDHYGGIPYLLLDFEIYCHRERDLNIYGPAMLGERLKELTLLLYPNFDLDNLNYKINFISLEADAINELEGYEVKALTMEHRAYSDCFGYRVSKGSKAFAYTGDTGWTEKIFELAADTGLFICECSVFEKVPDLKHIGYDEIVANLYRINTQRLILTHLGPEVLDKLNMIEVETAYDGLVVEI
jgi:ribonuclease BN (tRNA processing enzyme)